MASYASLCWAGRRGRRILRLNTSNMALALTVAVVAFSLACLDVIQPLSSKA